MQLEVHEMNLELYHFWLGISCGFLPPALPDAWHVHLVPAENVKLIVIKNVGSVVQNTWKLFHHWPESTKEEWGQTKMHQNIVFHFNYPKYCILDLHASVLHGHIKKNSAYKFHKANDTDKISKCMKNRHYLGRARSSLSRLGANRSSRMLLMTSSEL